MLTGMKKMIREKFSILHPSSCEAEVHITGLVLWFHLSFLGNVSIKHVITHTRGISLITRDWETQ